MQWRCPPIQTGVAPADCWNWGKWGLMEYKSRGPFLALFVGLAEKYFSSPCCSVSPVRNMFFLNVDYFTWCNGVSPSSSNLDLGRQSCRATCIWMCISVDNKKLEKYTVEKTCKIFVFLKKCQDREKASSPRERTSSPPILQFFYLFF